MDAAQTPSFATSPAPPPIPEFRILEIKLDESGYMVEAPHKYYGRGALLWKVIGEGGDLIFRASSEEAARKKIIRVLEHVVNSLPGPWPDWDIPLNDVEEFI